MCFVCCSLSCQALFRVMSDWLHPLSVVFGCDVNAKVFVLSELFSANLKLSRPRPAERQNEKASVFLPFGTRGTSRVCFFLVFSFRGPSARYSVFWCKIVAFIVRVPSRPLLHFWAEHAFLAFFSGWGLAIL